jgi:hypothetical protein
MSSSALTQVLLRLPENELDALDAYRREQKSPPSRNRAAEMLFRRALSDLSWAKEADHAAQ